MRVIAFSDSHGRAAAVARLFSETAATTQLYLFAGDGQSDVNFALESYQGLDVRRVRGNCDYCSKEPDVLLVEAGNCRILLTHGHNHVVKYGTDELERMAYENKAQLVVYGHTHCRDCRYSNGVYYVNPGSIALPRDGLAPSYAAIDIIPAGILVTLADLDYNI